jgi:CheY-like chemotaxis protein
MGKIFAWSTRWFRGKRNHVRLVDLSVPERHGTADMVSVKGLRVLLIDDNEHTRNLFAGALRHYDARVTAVDSARAAIGILGGLRPHVVVSNCVLDPAEGNTLMRLLRTAEVEDKRRIPTIALTAYGEAKHVLNQLAVGFQIRVPVPSDPYALVSIVGRVAPAGTRG